MQKVTHKKSLAPVLDDLLNDGRLARLLSKDAHSCALQLWVLQIKSEQAIENRVIYGRLLPYSYSSDSWSSTEDDNFQTFGQIQIQVKRLNLYTKSAHCSDILRHLSTGSTIAEISEDLKLKLSDSLKKRFGVTALATDNLAYRPVAYLLNRDSNDRRSFSSPHGGAGALSASITQADKSALFRLGQDYDIVLTESVVKHLNADTGLDFGGSDIARFGDIELLVFPTLDDQERTLLNVSWASDSSALIARFNPMQVPHFSVFQFRLCTTNNGQIIYSSIATAKPDAENVFECKFDLGEQLRTITDSTELEVFGFDDDHSQTGTLCCRWQIGYVREIHLQGHIVGQSITPVKFDWLEKSIRKGDSDRVKAALTINHDKMGFNNLIGGREADPWVSVNRDLASLFTQLHPTKSDGQFFLRRNQGDGDGRLQFVEWFRSLLTKYQQHQIVIFDPYFEDVGLGLLLICAASNTDFIVFRSLPKASIEEKLMRRKSDKTSQEGLSNLLTNCERNRHLLKRFKLRVYGLKDGRLHDRYLLIMGHDGLPVAGFHLSNSFQKATENYPLLMTPIPSDVLLEVEKYKAELVREAQSMQIEGGTENSFIQLLFNSQDAPAAPRHYDPLCFLESVNAGDVLGALIGEQSLNGLCGDLLKERMMKLNLLKNDSLNLPVTATPRNCLGLQSDFTATWEVLGEVFAHTCIGDSSFRELETDRDFLRHLEQYLDESFNRSHDDSNMDLSVVDAQLFRKPLESLLQSPYHPHHLFHSTKYAALSWSEYFAVKIMWWFAPDALLEIADAQAANIPMVSQGSDAVRLSLLSQIVSEISLSIQFDISALQRCRLIRSVNGLLQWMGWNAIEMELEKPGGLITVLQLITNFSYSKQIQILGWMIHHAAANPQKAGIYNDLVGALHKTMPSTVTAEELKRLVDSMRGHMRELIWVEPWLFQDVVSPLLQNNRVNIDNACDIWVRELADMLRQKQQSRLFDKTREGQTTNIAAYLFANSTTKQQQTTIESMFAILKRQKKIVQQPLASTSNWTQWNDALLVSMWILTFARWSQYYARERNITVCRLKELSEASHEIAMARSMDEWRSEFPGQREGLATFLDQVDKLLISGNE